MSYSELYFFRYSEPPLVYELSNSWGTGPVIWDLIFSKYKHLHPKGNEEYLSWLTTGNWLWELPRNSSNNLRSCEDILLTLTGGNTLVKGKNFASVSACIKVEGSTCLLCIDHNEHTFENCSTCRHSEGGTLYNPNNFRLWWDQS